MDITLVIGLIGFIGSISLFIFFIAYNVIKNTEMRNKGIYCGFSIYCGGKFGEHNLTFPFVRVQFDDDYLTITHSLHSERLYYKSINDVNLHEGIISKGIKIDAYIFDCNSFILWITNQRILLDYIRGKANN